MNERIVETLMSLRAGHAWQRFEGMSHAGEIITMPLVGVVPETDAGQRARMQPGHRWTRDNVVPGAIEVESEAAEDKEESQFSSAQLLGEHLALLELIDLHSEFSTTQLYKYFQWSASKGGRIRDELLAQEFITRHVEASRGKAGRRKESYAVTTKGKEILKHAKNKN